MPLGAVTNNLALADTIIAVTMVRSANRTGKRAIKSVDGSFATLLPREHICGDGEGWKTECFLDLRESKQRNSGNSLG